MTSENQLIPLRYIKRRLFAAMVWKMKKPKKECVKSAIYYDEIEAQKEQKVDIIRKFKFLVYHLEVKKHHILSTSKINTNGKKRKPRTGARTRIYKIALSFA